MFSCTNMWKKDLFLFTSSHFQSETYIESHFTEVLDCDEFLGLRSDQVRDLISSDTITVPSEERVYESVVAWVQHDVKQRGKHLSGRLPLKNYEYKQEDHVSDSTSAS